jgi:hypothetical protein
VACAAAGSIPVIDPAAAFAFASGFATGREIPGEPRSEEPDGSDPAFRNPGKRPASNRNFPNKIKG